MEALRNFEKFSLKNLHCLSGGKNLGLKNKPCFRPSFGDFRKFFKF